MPTNAPAQTVNTSGKSPEQIAAEMKAMQDLQNRRFMSLTKNFQAVCPANGGALSQSWASGQPLTYLVPSANNGYLVGFWVRFSGTITPGSGTNALYQMNAAGVLALFDSFQLLYGGTQLNIRPYILKYWSQLRGALRQQQPRAILAGQINSYLQSYYSGGTFPVLTNVANPWSFAVYVPLNFMHPQDVKGILPIQAGETQPQIVLTCAGSAFGVDPIYNTISLASGSNGSATVSATVSVLADFKTGKSITQLAAMQPNMSGINTVQFLKDVPLNNLVAAQPQMNKVSFPRKIPWLIATVVDGNSSTKFASTSNIQIIQATSDQTGTDKFLLYGQGTNLDVRAFYDELSGKLGGYLQQDIDEGILPFVTGPLSGQAVPGLLEGTEYLDCTDTGWSDFHYGVQLASVGGVAGIAPRIEAHCLIITDPLVQL